MVGMSVKLQGQIEKSDEPNLMEFDIKILSCLHAIAVHKLLQHGIIVLGIVTCDMTNLNQNMCEARVSQGTLAAGKQDTHVVNNLKLVADLVKDLSKVASIMSTVHLNETKQCMLQVPLPGGIFLNPVPYDSKI
jgi:hypothetical protein